MQISNSTGQSTSYRVSGGSGVTSTPGGDTLTSGDTTTFELLESGVLDPQQGLDCCLGDSTVAAVEFYIADQLVASRSFTSPPAQVSLMETAGSYWVDAPQEGTY